VNENTEEILAALANLPKNIPPSYHFGRGNSAELFMVCLDSSEFWATPCQKQFMDLR